MIPTFEFKIKNGDWNCVRCGKPLGAMTKPDGGWEVSIPADCPTRETCEAEVIDLADATLKARGGGSNA